MPSPCLAFSLRDPTNPTRCGFELVFADPDEGVLDQLAELIVMPRTAAREELSADARRALERRVFPRVRADLRAEVELPGIATTIRVYDISMSGCFLLFGSDSPPHGLEVGAEVRVSLFSPAPEYLSFRAIVARLGVKGEMPGVGVQFVGLSAEESARLEGLILEALLQEQGLPR